MALTTQTEVENFLQITISGATQIAAITQAISDVELVIKSYCRQKIDEVVNDVLTLDGIAQRKVYLPELPVTSITSVVEDGEALVAEDDYKLGANGVLWRIGNNWAAGIQNIVVTYTHGYAEDDIPEIIRVIATRAASRVFQSGLRAAETSGIIGVAATSIGDFSVSYDSGAGGGVGEGLLGASAANLLLRSEQRYLDEFRYKTL